MTGQLETIRQLPEVAPDIGRPRFGHFVTPLSVLGEQGRDDFARTFCFSLLS